MSTYTSAELGLAFGVCIGAGLSTTIGAALVLFRCINEMNHRLLAASLGFSAGVMIYVSLIEIFQKSYGSFQLVFTTVNATSGEVVVDETAAYGLATLMLFAGFGVTELISWAVRACSKAKEKDPQEEATVAAPPLPATAATTATADSSNSNDLEEATTTVVDDENDVTGKSKASPAALHKLERTGVLTAVAIGIHNLPEGLATFVSILVAPSVGVPVAIAIAAHNIPEGICVAMPVYYATGSRWKGFWLAFLSGLAEPVGALLGYLILVVLQTAIHEAANGVLFGFVAGMMVYISIKELLPTARRYDPEDVVTSYCVFAGCLVMALSLVLFLFA